MKLYQLLLGLLVSRLLFALPVYAADAEFAASKNAKPNILFILIDDLGYTDLGSYGSELYQTPHTDSLAKDGVRFTDAYSAAPICSPTRAAIMTGKSPANLHLTDWVPGHKHDNTKLLIPDWSHRLPEGQQTIGTLMKDAGYKTAWIGKWHIDPDRGAKDYGFDAGEQDWDFNEIKNEKDPKGAQQLTKEALDFINASGDEPFFVGLSHYTVHTPIHFNPEVRKKYAKLIKPDMEQKNAGYAALVESMDDSVGALLEGLEKSGKADNTIVIFYSDNGGLIGRTSNAPLRDGKATLYEGGVRVPLIVRFPDRKGAGTTTDAVMTSMDLLPTFLDIAGAKDKVPADIEGVSLLPHLRSGDKIDREAIYWHYPHYHRTKPVGSIRKGNYKLIEYFEDGKLELYDLEKDLSETTDLAEKMPEKVKELLADLRAWRKQVGAQSMTPNPDYVEKK